MAASCAAWAAAASWASALAASAPPAGAAASSPTARVPTSVSTSPPMACIAGGSERSSLVIAPLHCASRELAKTTPTEGGLLSLGTSSACAASTDSATVETRYVVSSASSEVSSASVRQVWSAARRQRASRCDRISDRTSTSRSISVTGSVSTAVAIVSSSLLVSGRLSTALMYPTSARGEGTSSGRHTGLHMLNYGPVSRSADSSERTAAASRQQQRGDSRLGSNEAGHFQRTTRAARGEGTSSGRHRRPTNTKKKKKKKKKRKKEKKTRGSNLKFIASRI